MDVSEVFIRTHQIVEVLLPMSVIVGGFMFGVRTLVFLLTTLERAFDLQVQPIEKAKNDEKPKNDAKRKNDEAAFEWNDELLHIVDAPESELPR